MRIAQFLNLNEYVKTKNRFRISKTVFFVYKVFQARSLDFFILACSFFIGLSCRKRGVVFTAKEHEGKQGYCIGHNVKNF